MAQLKNQHDILRSIFTGDSSSYSSNSALSFIERSSIYSAQLLETKQRNNERLLKLSKQQEGLLKSINKSTSNGLGITDLITSRFLGNFLSGKLKLVTRIPGVVGTGVAALGAVTYKAIMSSGKGLISSFSFGFSSLTRLDFLKNMPSILGMFKVTKTWPGISNLLNLMSKGVKFAPMLLSKLALPITTLFSLYSMVNGYKKADKIIGKPVGRLKKSQVAVTEGINSLLFGMPDLITQHFTGVGFSKWVDDKISSVWNFFSVKVPKFIKDSYQSILSKIKRLWNQLDVKKKLVEFGHLMLNTVTSLGYYITSGISSWFDSVFDYFSGSTSKSDMIDQDTDKLEFVRERSSARLAEEIGNHEVKLSVVPSLIIPSSLSNEDGSVNYVGASITGSLPDSAKQVFDLGSRMINSYGTEMVATQAEKSIESAPKTVSVLSEGVKSNLENIVGTEWTDIFKEFANNIPKIAKNTFEDMYSEDTKRVFQDLITGNMPSFDMAGAAQSAGIQTYEQDSLPGYDKKGIEQGYPNAPRKQTSKEVKRKSIGARGGEYGDGVEYYTEELTTTSNNKNKESAINAMLGTGADPKLVSAIAGNADVENPKWDPRNEHADPSRSNPGQRAAGLIQWDQSRTAKLHAFAKENNMDPYEASTQGLFALEETNPESRYADAGAVKAAKIIKSNPTMSVEEASYHYMMKSERPAEWAANKTAVARARHARKNYESITAKQKTVEKEPTSTVEASKPFIPSNSYATPPSLADSYAGSSFKTSDNINLNKMSKSVTQPTQYGPRIQTDETIKPLDVQAQLKDAVRPSGTINPSPINIPAKKKKLDDRRTKDDEDLEELSMITYNDVAMEA